MKLKELQKGLREKKLDGCLLYSEDPNFRYYLQEHVQSGMLFIPRQGNPTVFVHPLEELEHDFNVVRVEDKDTVNKFFKRKLERVGYNPSFTSAARYFRLRYKFGLKDVESELEELRKTKKYEEVKNLRKAARIADDIMQEAIGDFNFRTEGELKRFLKVKMAGRGVEQSFEPIVASEKGASTPHYFGDRKLKKGFLIVDMGVKVNGYCSDITRTFYIGNPGSDEKDLYEKVLRVQEECIRMCTKDRKCSDAYDHARQELGEEFSHGLGHGVGLKIHELPNLKPNSDERFRDSMVFTVEPGWYDQKKKIGIRIEDDVLMENGKPKLLTKTTKELLMFHNL